MDRTIVTEDFPGISINSDNVESNIELSLVSEEDGLHIFSFSFTSENPVSPNPITLSWKIPYVNMQGVWRCGGLHDKRQRYDWELDHLQSRISVDAPIISVFGHKDENRMTFACSDAINLVELNALIREEDNFLYSQVTLFQERHPEITEYTTELRIDTRDINFNNSIQETASWWETFEHLQPCNVPDIASLPLYSTWYNFHQELDEETLLKECKLAADLGYKLIILDDGWQTLDNNRGYDYTGDWEPDRFPNTANFVSKVHALGMKIGFWYSVPFCGKKSKAFQRFKGKFLEENHRWAPVFDPRYPEVREYLANIYATAVKDWNLDALKLDFIDDFKVYPSTTLTLADGRDYANVNEAVDQLMSEVMIAVKGIKPDIGIEFRQKYIGPAMRKYGNMFRAFDCPNDPISNRIRITDVKLLAGSSMVHSDMLTWHNTEKVELAALQVLNGFFGVPQMSILLKDASQEHLEMIAFYTNYWTKHKDILMNGKFKCHKPLSNYTILESTKNNHTIVSVHEDVSIFINNSKKFDILNAKMTDNIILKNNGNSKSVSLQSYNCRGAEIETKELQLLQGVQEIKVPVCGLLKIHLLGD